MKTLLVLICWSLLFVLAWPLAVLVVVLWPVAWLLSLPFRAVGLVVEAAFALLKTVLFLPARLLGHRAAV